MTSATVSAGRRRASAGALVAHLAAAMPLATLYVWLALVYGWQAWLTPTPSIFPDELQQAELARSIAEHGRPALRGVEQGFASLPAWLTAPAWLGSSVADGYLTAKLIGVLAMAAVVFPAYGLARLVAPRWPALWAAAASATIPAASYSGLLMQEPFAYPAATLAFYLGARALSRPTRSTIALATVAGAAAPLVRSQLALVPAVLLAAAGIMAWASDAGRRRRSGWRIHHRLAAAGVAALGLVAAHLLASRASLVWREAAETPRDVLRYAIWSVGALVLGLAVLPVVAALAAAATRRRLEVPEWRALVGLLVTAGVAFPLYTGAKVAYLDETWTPPVEERNVIYLAPLLLAGCAGWLGRRRVSPLALGAAALATIAALRVTPSILSLPYFEAPGFSLLAGIHRDLGLPAALAADAEVVLVALAAGVVLAAGGLHEWGRRVALGALAVVLGALVAGELYASAEQRRLAAQIRSEAVQPLDWLDRASGGRPVLYLGREIVNVNALLTLEFWNESLRYVGALGGFAPPPGPGLAQVVTSPDGTVLPDPGVTLLATDAELVPAGSLRAQRGSWRLYELEPPLRLLEDVEGRFSDGWMSRVSAYTRFGATEPGSTLEIRVGRTGWTGRSPPGAVTVRSGTVAIGAGGGALMGSVSAEQAGTVRSGEARTYRVAAPGGPFRVEVAVSPTFVPAELDPGSTDERALGAQVSFSLVPAQ